MSAAVHHQQGVYVTSEEAKAALISGTNIEIKETGKNVTLGNSIYSQTNFWIAQSREYVDAHTLTCYLYLIYIHWAFPALLVVSLFTPINAIFAFIMFGIGVFFFLIFTQHMYVNVKTMRHVLKQPSVPNQWLQRRNTFFEISIEKYRAFFATSSQAGIGHVIAGTGKVKIQVFQKTAFSTMKTCIGISTIYFLLTLFMVPYCLAWGIAGIVLIGV